MALMQLPSEAPDLDAEWPEKGSGRYVAGICPTCGGWTMFCDADSPTARDWARRSYVIGDLIVFWRDARSLGPGCPSDPLTPCR